jgi:hypothetical protein
MGEETLSVVCDSCGAKYGIPRDKVKGKVLRVPCKKCGAALIVRGDDAPSASLPPPPPVEQASPFDETPDSPFDETPEPGLFGESKAGFFGSEGQAGTAEVLSSAGDWDGGLFGGQGQQAPAAAPSKAPSPAEPPSGQGLFSLANLQTLSEDAPGPARAAAPLPGPGLLTAIENSGLVDIRSLSTGDEDPRGAPKTSHLDDLVSMGSTAYAPTLGAPVLAPVKREGMSLGAKIGIALGALGLVAGIAAVVVVLILRDDKPKLDPAAQEMALLRQQLDELKASGGSQSRKMAELQAQLEAKEKAASGGGAAPLAAATAPGAAQEKTGAAGRKAGGGGKGKAAAGQGEDTGSEEAEDTEEDERPVAQKPAGGKRNAELDSMLGDSITGSSAKKKPAAEQPAEEPQGGDLPATLDRAAVQSGMSAAVDRVAACGQGQPGTVAVRVVIGNDGRVLDARATGEFAGTPVGQCAARALLTARFPRFSNPKLVVTYPFKVQ